MTCQTNGQTQGPCPNYSFNANTNQISTSGYTYDASGDLTNDGTHSYAYDAEGRLTSVDNGTTATYVYNALGQRVERKTGGQNLEYAFDTAGESIGYLDGNQGVWWAYYIPFRGRHLADYGNSEVYFNHVNMIGTTGIVTDYAGTLKQDELHYPWGEEWALRGISVEERFAKLQHRDSETELDPTHFRMYSSGVGRWQSPDPARGCPLHPQNFDRYSYVAGSHGQCCSDRGLLNAGKTPRSIKTRLTVATHAPAHHLASAVTTGNSTYNLTFAYDRYGNMTCQTNGQTQGPCPNYSFNANTNQIKKQ